MNKRCVNCDGTGRATLSNDTCILCRGRGFLPQNDSPNCGWCAGSGIDGGHTCQRCKGSGKRVKTVKVEEHHDRTG